MKASLSASLRFKITAIVVAVTLTALGLSGTALVLHMKQSEFEKARRALQETSDRVRDTLAINHGLMTFAVDRQFSTLAQLLDGSWRLDEEVRVFAGGREVPRLTLEGHDVLAEFPTLAAYGSGGGEYAASIFVRDVDEFVRVTTSLTDGQGQPATGTTLERTHPAHSLLLAGGSYSGLVHLFDRPYMTRYQPLRDPSGRVIGALFVGLDMTAHLNRIKAELGAIRVGSNGYVFVVDARPGAREGELLVHPSRQGSKVLEVVEPASATEFLRALKEGGNGAGKIFRYQFREQDGRLREKIASLSAFPEWQWLISTSNCYEDFTEQRRGIQYAVGGALIVAAAAIIFALRLALRRYVLTPLLQLHETLRASETRFRTLVTSSDDLIYTTDADGRLTAVFDKGLVTSPAAIPGLIGQPVPALLGHDDTRHEPAHRRALDGEHVVYEWSVEGANGRTCIQSSLSPMRDDTGNVSGLVCIGRDITERQRAEQLALHLSQHDPLTGLPNRALMNDRLQQALRQAQRSGGKVGVLFLDLDRFKSINDEYGHATGDELLQAVAGRLQTCVRQSDTVARVGGDEFVIVIAEASDSNALARVADKLLVAFAEPFALTRCSVSMTPSIGISSYPADGTDPDTLLRIADGAMYEAKQSGRARARMA